MIPANQSNPTSPYEVKIPPPPYRRLRHFAFDPSLSRRIETYDINEVTATLPWDDGLETGPVDEYLEVVDYDPASQLFYAPVDLNQSFLLAQDGLAPSDSNPQFHQQMVYAVARTTIGHFEKALGRKALWSEHIPMPYGKHQFVQRLRIYPHAMREANAYYSSAKKALLFGYFPAEGEDVGDNYPGETVFSCLSHDIIAHETTHALLDGLHPRFVEPSNVDALAFHEAFADIVALFQHFTYPEILRHQIAHTRGDLRLDNLLGELAYQFGQAIGNYGALRSAIGTVDRTTQQWIPEKADPAKIHDTVEPHARGAILVAAVFDAFITVYNWRVAGLLRVATGGSGILPVGALHPDLVDLLAKEAADTAGDVLQICIRALDYCPPVDINFGDYLRALITADCDMVTDDKHNYRLAFIQAFRKRGIFPYDVRNMSEASLVWSPPDERDTAALKTVFNKEFLNKLVPDWNLDAETREYMFNRCQENQQIIHNKLIENPGAAAAVQILLDNSLPKTYYRKFDAEHPDGVLTFQVHSVRPAKRVGPDGNTVTDLVVEIIQSRLCYFDPKVQDQADKGNLKQPEDFILRGGCTMLIDSHDGTVRYCIYKRLNSDNRLNRMREYLTGNDSPSLRATYFGDPHCEYYRSNNKAAAEKKQSTFEPFAFLHRSSEIEEE
jgi:hypothetical protein